MKINAQMIEDLSQQLLNLIPAPFIDLNENLKKNFRAALVSFFERMDLVTREEFDAQVRVLHRALKRLDELEAVIDAENPPSQ